MCFLYRMIGIFHALKRFTQDGCILSMNMKDILHFLLRH